MKIFEKENIKWVIVFLAALLHLLYFYSASTSHLLDKYFLPVTQGQDFFQIPNGAKDFLNGEKLNGSNHSYINCCGVNDNVYHPVFTLLVGIPLQVFKPWTSFNLWLFLHLLTGVCVVFFLIKNFKKHKYLPLALAVFFASSFQYYEILNNQYHFLINISTLFLLNEIWKERDSTKGGLFFLIGLLTKPIGIFWSFPLLLAKRLKILLIGAGGIFLFTFPFYFSNIGEYYFSFLKQVVLHGNYPDWNIFYLFNSLGINNLNVGYVKFLLLSLVIIFSILNKKRPIISIFLFIIYSLMIFQNTFPYHFSILSTIFPLVLLTQNFKKSFFVYVSIFFLIVPAPIFGASIIHINELEVQQVEKFIFIFWSNLCLISLILLILSNSSLSLLSIIRKNIYV